MVKKVRVGRSWGRGRLQGKPGSRSKYNVDLSERGKAARTVDGITFPSKAEARRYVVLKGRQEAGLISDLRRQPRFVLQEAFTDSNGERQSAITYTADFRYVEDGAVVVEEVKGRETRDFKLRKRLFLRRFPQYRYKLVYSKDVLTAP